MRVDKQSIRHKNIETLCGALDKKCLEHDGYLNYSFLKESEYDYSLPEDENAFAYLVFDEDDNLIAYLGYLKIDSNNMQVCMAVDPDHRRQKIGTNLFLRLVSEFDSCSYQVSLDPSNEIGKSFLEKLGFEYTSTEKAMCLSKEDFSFDADAIELFDIEVKEEYREKGYGNRILQTTIKDAFKQADKIILHVSTNNTPALKLYKKVGFKTIDTIDCYEL